MLGGAFGGFLHQYALNCECGQRGAVVLLKLPFGLEAILIELFQFDTFLPQLAKVQPKPLGSLQDKIIQKLEDPNHDLTV